MIEVAKFPKDVISIRDFTKELLLYVIEKAKFFDPAMPQCYSAEAQREMLANKIMAALFWEASTRTRLSFMDAIKELGGLVNGFSVGTGSSYAKGETVYDTIKMVEAWAHVIVMRHFIEGSARLASEVTDKCVINAGDGANEHPTQTLLDLYTIDKECGSLEGKKIGIVGDLKYGRTVHSLTTAMSHFSGTEFYFIAPEMLAMPKDYLDELDEKGISYHQTESLTDYLLEMDVLYMTRIQRERFPEPSEYELVKDVYGLDAKMLFNAKPNLKILHPLPRVNEIKVNVDFTPYARYFQQAANGIPVRKAILCLTMGVI